MGCMLYGRRQKSKTNLDILHSCNFINHSLSIASVIFWGNMFTLDSSLKLQWNVQKAQH